MPIETQDAVSDHWCYINGQVVPSADALVSVRDLGMLRGFGVYDGITVIDGKPLRLSDHVQRFAESAAGLGLRVPEDEAEIEAAYRVFAERMNAPRFNTRMILTGGATIDGLGYDPTSPTFYILAEPFTPLADELYADGGSLVTHEFQRQFAQYKTINYISAVLSFPRRVAASAVETLFVSGGQMLECSTSNVFIVRDGTLFTPVNGILRGITRRMVIELMSTDHEVRETAISIEDLFAADEVFITSSFKDIVGITTIDGRRIHDGVGRVTREVMDRYATAAGLAAVCHAHG